MVKKKRDLTGRLGLLEALPQFRGDGCAPGEEEVADFHLSLIQLLERRVLADCPQHELSQALGVSFL